MRKGVSRAKTKLLLVKENLINCLKRKNRNLSKYLKVSHETFATASIN